MLLNDFVTRCDEFLLITVHTGLPTVLQINNLLLLFIIFIPINKK